MFGVPDYGAFLLGAVLIILLPGPNSMYVLATAARDGVARGYLGAAGVFLSDSLLMVASVAGVASLLQAHPLAFLVVKYAGAGYLAWIGIRLAVGGWRRARSATASSADGAGPEATVGSDVPQAVGRGGRRASPFVGALVLGLLNPKSILFFVAFFVQFVDPTSPHALQSFLVLAVTLQILSMAYLTTLILGAAALAARFRRHPRTAGAATAGVGLVFLGFGAKLATATIR